MINRLMNRIMAALGKLDNGSVPDTTKSKKKDANADESKTEDGS